VESEKSNLERLAKGRKNELEGREKRRGRKIKI
jgi:hypothetical protein